jgi:hypothetical protein
MQPRGAAYARELDRMRKELLSLCELDALPGIDIAFAASGTDLHLLVASLCANAGATRVIIAGAEETGRGVPLAAAACHFATRSPSGKAVAEGKPVDTDTSLEVVSVPIRTSDGMPRPSGDIDREVAALAREAAAAQRRVLLIVVDVSKTGMIAPSPDCAASLHRELGDRVDVMVDACQFRLAPATLQAYLRQGFLVAVTGSKFLTGPAFAGALFIPEQLGRRLRACPLPPALAAYSLRAEFPDGWSAAHSLEDNANFGLLLRWEAALQELRAFRAVPAAEIAHSLRAFAHAVRRRLQDDPAFEPLSAPAPERGAFGASDGWDRIATIFPFLLREPRGGRLLRREQAQHIHHLLQQGHAGLRCQFGQPVASGERDGMPVSALRLCASARLAVEAAGVGGVGRVIEKAMAALDQTSLLIKATA